MHPILIRPRAILATLQLPMQQHRLSLSAGIFQIESQKDSSANNFPRQAVFQAKEL